MTTKQPRVIVNGKMVAAQSGKKPVFVAVGGKNGIVTLCINYKGEVMIDYIEGVISLCCIRPREGKN